MVDTGVWCVQDRQLSEFLEMLSHGLPRTNGLRISGQNVVNGRVKGRFYVDNWPNFTTVVFQCLQPSISNTGDLLCYTTSLASKQQLARFLDQAGLITAGSWQFLYIIEDEEKSVAECLVQSLLDNGRLSANHQFKIESSGLYVMPHPPKEKVDLPSGFTFGKLTKEHAGYVCSQEGLFASSSTERPSHIMCEYVSKCLEMLETAAVYSDDDASTPVAGIACHSYSGVIGNLFTVKDHRRKGLASALVLKQSEHYFSQGVMPQAEIEYYNSSSIDLHIKLGFVCVSDANSVYMTTNL